MISREIDPTAFKDYKAAVGTTPEELFHTVLNTGIGSGGGALINREGRELVYNFIDRNVSDPDTRHASLVQLAYATQKGIGHMDLAPTSEEQAKDAQLKQYEGQMVLPHDLAKKVQEERGKLTQSYNGRIKEQWDRKKEDNPQRLDEFEKEIGRLLHSRPPINEDNALMAYRAVEELQQYLITHDAPTAAPLGKLARNNTTWPVGIPHADKNTICDRLTDYAAKFIEKAPAAERTGLWLRQTEILPDVDDKNKMLRKAFAELSNVAPNDQVDSSLKVAEAAIQVDAQALEAKNTRAANAARRVEQDALENAIQLVDALPRTTKETYHDFSKSKKPWARNAYWTNAPGRKTEREVISPEFKKGREAIAKFNASRVQEMIESVDTATALADTADFWSADEVHSYWAPIIRGLHNGIIETRTFLQGNDEVERGVNVSASKLKKMRRYWPNFVAVVPPEIATQADKEIDELLVHARIAA